MAKNTKKSVYKVFHGWAFAEYVTEFTTLKKLWRLLIHRNAQTNGAGKNVKHNTTNRKAKIKSRGNTEMYPFLIWLQKILY